MAVDKLHRASWRGVPFGMDQSAGRYGRRIVQHAYPYRDTVWPEDQGKLPREFRIVGFLLSDSLIYGGGDVVSQIKKMERAAEASGAGTLVHPTRGHITVTLLDFVIYERTDDGFGSYAEVQFNFLQGGQQLFPAVLSNLSALVGKAAGLADAAGIGDFVAKVAGPLRNGLDAAASISATAGEWLDKVQGLARDATGLYGTLSQLGGADFGRFFNGRNAGFLAGLSSLYAGATSVRDLIVIGSDKRAAVVAASDAVLAGVADLGVETQPADLASAMQAAVVALGDATADPGDGVRIMAALAAFTPSSAAARTPAGLAVTDLFQRAAAASIARISATYAPSSSDDAHAVRAVVLAPIEAAIARAGATAADDAFAAFRGLRKAVVDDLGGRGGALVRLADVRLPRPTPAVVVAQQRYRDAARADELVTQAQPIHPWFMPTAFKALAS